MRAMRCATSEQCDDISEGKTQNAENFAKEKEIAQRNTLCISVYDNSAIQ